MLIRSETTLRLIILSFVTIASSTPMSNSRLQSRRYLEKGPTIPAKIGTNPQVKAIRADLRTTEASPPIGRSARNMFFWPWHPRWYGHRWWHRPFGYGGGIYSGVGFGMGSGAGLVYHRPVRIPGFGDTSGIGVGLGAGISGGYRPGVGIGAGAGAAIGAGIVPSQPIYNHYDHFDNNANNGAYNDPEKPINYPDLPPITNDFDGQPPSPSNGADFSGPSAVGFDDGAEHSVGYDRAVHKSVRHKNQGYLDTDHGRYHSNANYEIDRGSEQHNGSYVTIDDANRKGVIQWFRDRHKKLPTGQSGYEGDRNYLKGRETNSDGGDYDGEERETYYEDRYHDYPVAEQRFLTDRDLAYANHGV